MDQRTVENKESKAWEALKAYRKKLQGKYGPTYNLDWSDRERLHYAKLGKALDLPAIASDGITHD